MPTVPAPIPKTVLGIPATLLYSYRSRPPKGAGIKSIAVYLFRTDDQPLPGCITIWLVAQLADPIVQPAGQRIISASGCAYAHAQFYRIVRARMLELGKSISSSMEAAAAFKDYIDAVGGSKVTFNPFGTGILMSESTIDESMMPCTCLY